MTDNEKIYIYYMAKTELYDRALTIMRSPYDSTEAFITDKFSRRLSNKYAITLSQKLHIGSIKKTIHPSLLHMSAQWYIDVFNNLYENNELDFIEKYLENI